MIISVRHKGLKRLIQKGDTSGINKTMRARVEEILTILSEAETVEDANIPGYRLHPLTGKSKGLWSVRVTKNWRIVFRFEDGDVSDLDLVDYH